MTIIEKGIPKTILEADGLLRDEDFVDDELFTDLSTDTRDKVLEWIVKYLRPCERVNWKWSSYGLKHLLEHKTGIYLTENQFKQAMLIIGYKPAKTKATSWNFRIDKKSPAFKG